MYIMRILRIRGKFPVYSLVFFSVAARVGFIASTWIVLMSRFHVSPILSGLMSLMVQGLITVMKPLSSAVFKRVSLLTSQRAGAILGLTSCFALLFIHNIILFLAIVFCASFSKVMIEATFPRVTHAFLVQDTKFAPRLIGVQEGSILFVSAAIAPVAFAGSVLIPLVIAAVLYACTWAITYLFPECGSDSYEETLDSSSTTEQFNRRFSDIALNESIREYQSRIHKFRRIPSTLLSMDLFLNIIAGGCMALMPLCFKYISNVSQGMDSTLCFVYGGLAALTGFVLLPTIRKRATLTETHEWVLLVAAMGLGVITCVYYTTFAGVHIALLSAVVNGMALVTMQSLLRHVAARNLMQGEYQQFGCRLMQRNAIARVCSPIVVGVLASVTSLHFTMMVLLGLGGIFIAITVARVSLILYGRRYDYRLLASIEDPSHPARRLRTVRREGTDIVGVDANTSLELLRRRRIRSSSQPTTHHRLSVRSFRRGFTFTLSQKDSAMASTRWTSR